MPRNTEPSGLETPLVELPPVHNRHASQTQSQRTPPIRGNRRKKCQRNRLRFRIMPGDFAARIIGSWLTAGGRGMIEYGYSGTIRNHTKTAELRLSERKAVPGVDWRCEAAAPVESAQSVTAKRDTFPDDAGTVLRFLVTPAVDLPVLKWFDPVSSRLAFKEWCGNKTGIRRSRWR